MFEKQHESIDDIKRKLKVLQQHHKTIDHAAVDAIKDVIKKLHGVVNFHHDAIKDHIKT